MLFALLAAFGCTDAAVMDTTGEEETGDIGTQPMGQGVMYSACISLDQCDSLEFCVFPSGEEGFCSAACGAGDDNAPCDILPNGLEDATCLDIGLVDDRRVCAIDCAQGRRCPTGMRCEDVESAGVARSICF